MPIMWPQMGCTSPQSAQQQKPVTQRRRCNPGWSFLSPSWKSQSHVKVFISAVNVSWLSHWFYIWTTYWCFFCALQSRFVSISNLFVPNEDGKKSQVIKYSSEKTKTFREECGGSSSGNTFFPCAHVRYLCRAHVMQQTTVRVSVRTSETCTAGSRERSLGSEDHTDTSLRTLTTTNTSFEHHHKVPAECV